MTEDLFLKASIIKLKHFSYHFVLVSSFDIGKVIGHMCLMKRSTVRDWSWWSKKFKNITIANSLKNFSLQK